VRDQGKGPLRDLYQTPFKLSLKGETDINESCCRGGDLAKRGRKTERTAFSPQKDARKSGVLGGESSMGMTGLQSTARDVRGGKKKVRRCVCVRGGSEVNNRWEGGEVVWLRRLWALGWGQVRKARSEHRDDADGVVGWC